MDFRYTDEQLEFKKVCRRFADEVIRPAAPAHDADESTPWEVIREARRQNLEGLDYLQRLATDEDGQLGVIYGEEMHYGCAGTALAISGSALAAAGLAASGTPEQIGEWMPKMFGTGDDLRLGAYAVTEPQAGSDVKGLRTTARRDGDEWVLNGTKVFITNGGIADVNIVVATVDPELGHRAQVSFVVPSDAPGFSEGKKETKLGIRASRTTELIFEDCRIPLDNLLGGMDKLERKLERARSGESAGKSNALATFEITRPLVGAGALGIGQAAYEWTLAYLDGRTADGYTAAEIIEEGGFSTSGLPMMQRQRIQQVLADVATEMEAARLLVQRGAWMGRAGVPMGGGQGSMAKLKAGDVTMWAVPALMDLVGPYAQTTECPLEKWMRDAKIYQLFEGTAQVQRLVISRMQATEYREYREQLAAGVEIGQDAMREADRADEAGAETKLEHTTVAAGS
ncbi:MAG: acyl-CoA dehydrogenase family protein [Solirubrobacterales bacterium]